MRETTTRLECPVVVDGVVISTIADHSRFETSGLSDIFPLLPSPVPSSANSSRFSIDGAHLETISDNLRLSPKSRSHHKRTASSSSFVPQRSKFANFGRAAPSKIPAQDLETEERSVDAGIRASPSQLPKLAIPNNELLRPPNKIPVPTPPIRLPLSPLTNTQNSPEVMRFFGQRSSRHSAAKIEEGAQRNKSPKRGSLLFSSGGFPERRREEAVSPGFTSWLNSSPSNQVPTSRGFKVSPESPSAGKGISQKPGKSFRHRIFSSILNRNPSPISDGQTATKTSTKARIHVSPVSPLDSSISTPETSISPIIGTNEQVVRPRRETSWFASPTDTEAPAQLVEPRECVVCDTEYPLTHFPERPTSRCHHESRTCSACVSAWIATGMDGDSPERIKCPDSSCSEILTHADVFRHASLDVFEQYDALLAKLALTRDPHFRWCVRPGCRSGQLHETAMPIMTCSACHFPQCAAHAVEWHYGETCAQYNARRGAIPGGHEREEVLSALALSDVSKLCPNEKCGYRLQKVDGCDHMRCSRCRYEFCWLCLAEYSGIRQHGNTYHNAHCKYHTLNIRDRALNLGRR